MSAIKNYDDALDFLPKYQGDEGLATRFGKALQTYSDRARRGSRRRPGLP